MVCNRDKSLDYDEYWKLAIFFCSLLLFISDSFLIDLFEPSSSDMEHHSSSSSSEHGDTNFDGGNVEPKGVVGMLIFFIPSFQSFSTFFQFPFFFDLFCFLFLSSSSSEHGGINFDGGNVEPKGVVGMLILFLFFRFQLSFFFKLFQLSLPRVCSWKCRRK